MGKVGRVLEGFDDEMEDELEQYEAERKGENEEDDGADGGDGVEVGIDRRGVNLSIRGYSCVKGGRWSRSGLPTRGRGYKRKRGTPPFLVRGKLFYP